MRVTVELVNVTDVSKPLLTQSMVSEPPDVVPRAYSKELIPDAASEPAQEMMSSLASFR